MADETKSKKPRKPAAPKPVEELVQHALTLAATKPDANWTGKSAKALFNENEANADAAIAECTTGDAPLLQRVGKTGVLTPAGFAKAASALPEADAISLTKTVAVGLPAGERIRFLSAAIGRTPTAAAELTSLLEAATAEDKATREDRVAAAAEYAATEEANRAALRRAIAVLDEHRRHRLDALRREWGAEGADTDDLSEVLVRKLPKLLPPEEPDDAEDEPPAPRTGAEKDFRRNTADRLAAAWRDAWDAKKDEGRDSLEAAIWNIRGMKMIGEVGAKVAFDGRRHESDSPVFTGSPAAVVRPGWLLSVDDEEYVALKAAVVKV